MLLHFACVSLPSQGLGTAIDEERYELMNKVNSTRLVVFSKRSMTSTVWPSCTLGLPLELVDR